MDDVRVVVLTRSIGNPEVLADVVHASVEAGSFSQDTFLSRNSKLTGPYANVLNGEELAPTSILLFDQEWGEVDVGWFAVPSASGKPKGARRTQQYKGFLKDSAHTPVDVFISTPGASGCPVCEVSARLVHADVSCPIHRS